MRADMKSEPAPVDTAIVRASGPVRPWDDVHFQKLWLATQRREWRSIALLGTGKFVDTLPIAELLAGLAWSYRGQRSSMFDLRDLSLRLVEYHVREVKSQVDDGAYAIIALRSVFENPTAAPIAKSADAIIICVRLGATEFKAIEQTVAEVGNERVLGSIVLRDRTPK